MNTAHSSPDSESVRKWLDRLWITLLIILLAYTYSVYRSGRFCAYLGTDFRGYYAAAQIARERGFAEVYNQQTQELYQAALIHRCPDSTSAPPLINVSMPYLPVFIVLFLPLTFLDFTTSYYLWVAINLALLLIYLLHFISALGTKVKIIRALQWMLCVPVFSNLVLGQMNVFLVICLGEFVLAYSKGRSYQSGFWLGGMLMKPHTLILLLPGLLLSRSWKVLLGFAGCALLLVGGSSLLAGVQGVWSSVSLASRFAGSLIQTGPTMMNFRALALNLGAILPDGFAWTVAVCGMILVAALTLYLWLRHFSTTSLQFLFLILATLAATFATTWHSHFYLLMLMIPLLLYFDLNQIISARWVWAWILGPPLFYGLLYLASPEEARNWFGLGMLALNLFLLFWSAKWLRNNRQLTQSPVD